MMCFVYRPKKSLLYSGRYRFDAMPRPVTVVLKTPDEMTARKRLMDLIVRKQREAEGLATPELVSDAARTPLPALVNAYGLDLLAQRCTPLHVKDTTRRVLRAAKECRWRFVGEVSAQSFMTWRAKIAPTISAKTLNEYQVSLNAFFAWLIVSDRVVKNPLAKVPSIETRGETVHNRRAFSPAELGRLLTACKPHHRLPYLFILYTGLRFREAWGVTWADIDLDSGTVSVEAGRTKDREKRVIPLHPALLEELREFAKARRSSWTEARRVFRNVFPSQRKGLKGDLAAARIDKRDTSGRVVDWHSFRKTWQTMGVNAGVNQRSAQAILGHSSPEMTAKAYTDVPSLELHREVSKLPWFGTPITSEKSSSASSSQATPLRWWTQLDSKPQGHKRQRVIFKAPWIARRISELPAGIPQEWASIWPQLTAEQRAKLKPVSLQLRKRKAAAK